MLQIKSLKDVVTDGKVKALVYGFSGAGKTRLIATLPGKGLVLSAEAGLLSLRTVLDQCGDVDVAEVGTIDDVRAAYKHVKDNPTAYQWVALDSLSEIAEVVLVNEKKQTNDPRQAYGALIDSMLELVKAFRDLPLDVYMICKAERVKDEATGRMLTQIMTPGAKLAQALPFLFDEILFLFAEEVAAPDGNGTVYQRFLQTRRGPTTEAKDRSGKLDPLEPADLGKLLAKIRA